MKKINKHLEWSGKGKFHLIGELPEGSIDSHVHLGVYLRAPFLGGINLTGSGQYKENLKYHIDQLLKHRNAILKELKTVSFSSIDGLLDVALFKTEFKKAKFAPIHLLTSLDSFFDIEAPFYCKSVPKVSLNLLKDVITIFRTLNKVIDDANLENLLKYLESYNLKQAVVLPIETGRFTKFSETAFQACAGKKQVIPFFSVHPRHPRMEEQFAYFVDKGGKGFKFHPEFQGVAPDSENAFKIFEQCAKYNLPVVSHVGGLKTKGSLSHPNRYQKAICHFKDVIFILCHIGLADKDATISIAKKYQNTYLETSGQTVAGIKEASKVIGTDRILFGSDWPLYHPAVPISCVLGAFSKDGDKEKIFRDNLLSLL